MALLIIATFAPPKHPTEYDNQTLTEVRMSGISRRDENRVVGEGPIIVPEEGCRPSADDMDQVRVFINAIIDAIIERAARDNISEDKLKRVFRKSEPLKDEQTPPTMRPKTLRAWERLFGFKEYARGYLPREGRADELNPIQIIHINCIEAALRHLEICHDAPPFGETPSSWLPFLDHALAAIKGVPIEASRGYDSAVEDASVLTLGKAVVSLATFDPVAKWNDPE